MEEKAKTTITVPRNLRDRIVERAQWGGTLWQVIEEALDRLEYCEAHHEPPPEDWRERRKSGKTPASEYVLAGIR